ncbi:MAG: alginate O-acetyltransferase AlgX-related protein [Planctomycetota bacterium]
MPDSDQTATAARHPLRTAVLLCFALATVPAAELAEHLTRWLDGEPPPAIEAEDGWWYLGAELEAYAKPAPTERKGGPVAGIAHYQRLLAAHGIGLVVMPVPGKVASHPDPLLGEGARRSASMDAVFAALRKEGVRVLDLREGFAALRDAGVATHCRQDSHWSPRGLEAAAEQLAARVVESPWHPDSAAPDAVQREGITLEALGDLPPLIDAAPEPEILQPERIIPAGTAAVDDASPVVLVGDSHALVFHQPIAGGIQSNGCGLADHLLAHTGLGVDLVANQGSGVNAPWISLARRRGERANLAGKRLVIWCFAARDLLDPDVEWKQIPVIR